MARAIFQTIYDNVKQSIDDGTYAYQSYLPSETELTQLFDCSRMTVRRAISMLAADGYVLPQQGKGMRVIRNISDEKSRGGGGLETFKEIATSRGFELKTVTTVFELLICSKALSGITGFPEGCELSVLGALPTDLRSRDADRRALGAGMLLHFTVESAREQQSLTRTYAALLSGAPCASAAFETTLGHWARGVE